MDKSNLEVSYHREMKKNYLMIAVEEAKEQSFETRMLIGNTIEGLLKFRVRKTDGCCQFCYEITSKQPLKRYVEIKSMGATQIRSLLLGITQTLIRMEEYLLKESQILLDPEFIYVDSENFYPGLCLLPGKEGDFPKEFSEFLQFLLDKVDHQDKEAVVLIYGLYRESLKENYGLDNLMQWLTKEECPKMDNERNRIEFESADMEAKAVSEIEKLTETQHLRNEEADKKPQSVSVPFPFLKVAVCGLLMPAFCVVLWLWQGQEGIDRLLTQDIMFAAGGVLISLIGIVAAVWRWKQSGVKTGVEESKDLPLPIGRTTDMNPSNMENSWQMVFCQEEPEIEIPREEPEEDSHTALLWSREPEDVHCLISADGKSQSISLAYFPFLIGKQENLTDYTLSNDTVSRLHLRIDKKDDKYFLTDLNSTNGTCVNGRRLDNNETIDLRVGDMVGIADLQFIFQ